MAYFVIGYSDDNSNERIFITRNFSPNFQGAFTAFTIIWKEIGGMHLEIGYPVCTLEELLCTSSFCIFTFCWEQFSHYSFFVVPIFVDTIHSYLRAIERFVARLELLQPLLWVFFHHRITSPFSDTPLTILATALPSSQCPCRMIWFEEILKGSYKVVLCPRSGEGYFGLARRTYSLQCPPDIAAVRLNRFTFR